ncbi:NnrS family protein [Pandoraea terrigena]|uniref:NnrS family protein n=1 Tax=Pandoraea terrigena TaxID=2508292 RepID=A0A5E4X010_9BURK|nr:NnrS family protein [Pandoraea terrigena]VVE29621.1 NnrS family protein [Pandoraea terrigena]
MSIGKPTTTPSGQPASGLPLLRLGFRPFYLGGAGFSALAIALWLAALHGYPIAGRTAAMNGVIWHVHEMIFGAFAAIVVGFLLTAVRAWTSLDTPRGASLMGLWALWATGRLLVYWGPEWLAAGVDSLFLPVVAIVLLRVLIQANNRRNIFLTVALGLFGALNVLFHWWAWHGRPDLALQAGYAAIGLVVMFVTVIAGRVVPMFTANAVPGYAPMRWKWIERLAAPSVVITLFADAFLALPALTIACAGFTALIHGIRLAGWRSWRVGTRPILAILHVAYAWIPVGFALLALAAAGAIAHSLAIHALTVGAIGCAILGMITRTALGHTGRALIAGQFEVASYALIIAAALLRVFGPWLASRATSIWIDAAAACWLAAFTVYLIRYVPYLVSARIDGKAG